jgi:MoxR-like ATPase
MNDRALRFQPLASPAAIEPRREPDPGDLRDGTIYSYVKDIEDAVQVALATNRPLLVSGPPGSGKSSLAPNVARRLGWRYYTLVIGSRTQASDLLWSFDAVRRLADAQTQQLRRRNEHYLEPGVLWWAFEPASARRRGLADGEIETADFAAEPDELALARSADEPAVVLIDEIDKADPDVPNDLLVPLGSYQFRTPGGMVKARHKPLVIITTNRERDLPPAFKRRCIELPLEAPDVARLVEIAKLHFGAVDERIYRAFAERTYAAGQDMAKGERPPSTAEFLDAIHAWRGLRQGHPDEARLLEAITGLTIRKPTSE